MSFYVDHPSPCLQKLDASMPWLAAAKLCYHGVRLGIRSSQPLFLHRLLAELLPRPRLGAAPLTPTRVDGLYSLVLGGDGSRRGVRRMHVAYEGHRMLCRCKTLEEALREVQADMHRFVAERAPRHVFVHAGAVLWRGSAILIPGKSCSGKTTLVAALVRAGAAYLSDEYAVLDHQGHVHPFPRTLLMRHHDGSRAPLAPRLLGKQARAGAYPVGAIIDTRFKEGATWRPRAVSDGAASLALLGNCIAVRQQPQRALHAITQVTRHASAWRSPRGEAERAAAAILQWRDAP